MFQVGDRVRVVVLSEICRGVVVEVRPDSDEPYVVRSDPDTAEEHCGTDCPPECPEVGRVETLAWEAGEVFAEGSCTAVLPCPACGCLDLSCDC